MIITRLQLLLQFRQKSVHAVFGIGIGTDAENGAALSVAEHLREIASIAAMHKDFSRKRSRLYGLLGILDIYKDGILTQQEHILEEIILSLVGRKGVDGLEELCRHRIGESKLVVAVTFGSCQVIDFVRIVVYKIVLAIIPLEW